MMWHLQAKCRNVAETAAAAAIVAADRLRTSEANAAELRDQVGKLQQEATKYANQQADLQMQLEQVRRMVQ